MNTETVTPESCSGCSKSSKDVELLIKITETDFFICNECTQRAHDLVLTRRGASPAKRSSAKPASDILRPHEIYKTLDDYVVGQEQAKKVLSVAVYNHYKRLNCTDDVQIDKSNVLLIGSTGTGKTLLASTLARILDVPFTIADATTLTESGYVGEDVESIVTKLLQAANYDVAKAERGIIYVDEIDKITKRSDSPSITRDVSGEGVQQALLKLIEGYEANVTAHGGRKNPQEQTLTVDTSKILFICGGSFPGLEKIVSNRLQEKSIGFGAVLGSDTETPADAFDNVEPADLAAYGLIPEFIGRLPVVASLRSLDEDALCDIMVNPKNAIARQFQALFAMDKISLDFEPEALRAIARTALKRGTGARGLRSIVEKILLDRMFDGPRTASGGSLLITEDVVNGDQDLELVPAPVAKAA